jgi:hypothetical protein
MFFISVRHKGQAFKLHCVSNNHFDLVPFDLEEVGSVVRKGLDSQRGLPETAVFVLQGFAGQKESMNFSGLLRRHCDLRLGRSRGLSVWGERTVSMGTIGTSNSRSSVAKRSELLGLLVTTYPR